MDSEIYNKKDKYPPNYLAVQLAQREKELFQEMNDNESSRSESSETQNDGADNDNSGLKKELDIFKIQFIEVLVSILKIQCKKIILLENIIILLLVICFLLLAILIVIQNMYVKLLDRINLEHNTKS